MQLLIARLPFNLACSVHISQFQRSAFHVQAVSFTRSNPPQTASNRCRLTIDFNDFSYTFMLFLNLYAAVLLAAVASASASSVATTPGNTFSIPVYSHFAKVDFEELSTLSKSVKPFPAPQNAFPQRFSVVINNHIQSPSIPSKLQHDLRQYFFSWATQSDSSWLLYILFHMGNAANEKYTPDSMELLPRRELGKMWLELYRNWILGKGIVIPGWSKSYTPSWHSMLHFMTKSMTFYALFHGQKPLQTRRKLSKNTMNVFLKWKQIMVALGQRGITGGMTEMKRDLLVKFNQLAIAVAQDMGEDLPERQIEDVDMYGFISQSSNGCSEAHSSSTQSELEQCEKQKIPVKSSTSKN